MIYRIEEAEEIPVGVSVTVMENATLDWVSAYLRIPGKGIGIVRVWQIANGAYGIDHEMRGDGEAEGRRCGLSTLLPSGLMSGERPSWKRGIWG